MRSDLSYSVYHEPMIKECNQVELAENKQWD